MTASMVEQAKRKRGLDALGVLVACVFSLIVISPAMAEEHGSLKITSPENKAVLGSDVEVTWEVQVPVEKYHVHIKIDSGRPMVVHSTSKHLKGLKAGQHAITIWIVDSDHQPMDLEDRVEFTVE